MFSSTIPNKYVWTTALGRPNWVSSFGGYNWDYNTLGAVFGITLDYVGTGNIYVSNSSIYTGESVTKHDAVYKINGTTGAVTQIINLSGTNPNRGIGNLKYFRSVGINYIVLSWWEDGKLYVFKETTPGTWVLHNSFAPKFGNTSTNPNIIPYGVAIRNTPVGLSVFYGEFNLSVYAPGTSRVFSTPLSAAVTFGTTETLELSVPVDYLPVSNGDKSPVSDISFSNDYTRILLAQQTLQDANTLGAHRSRVHEYKKTGGSWLQLGKFPSGYNSGVPYPSLLTATPTSSSGNISCNAAGGVSYSNNILFKDGMQAVNLKCDTTVLYTSDWIYFADFAPPIRGPLQPAELASNFGGSAPSVYGIQGLPAQNNFSTDLDAFSYSLKVSEFANSVGYDKSNLGDVEAFIPNLNCGAPVTCNCQNSSWTNIAMGSSIWWAGPPGTIPTLSYTLGQPALSGVLFPSYNCGTSNCNATYVFTLLKPDGTSITLPNSSGSLNLTQIPFGNLPCNTTYYIVITPICGTSNCTPVRIPLVYNCSQVTQLPCNCKGDVTINASQQGLTVTPQSNTTISNPVSTVTGSFTLTASLPVTEVRMLVEEFRLSTTTGNENCLLCRNKPQTWASINAATLSGVTPKTIVTPALNNDTREFVFNNGLNTMFNLTGNTLNFALGVPGVTGLNCCKLKGDVCIKFIIRDVNCCEREVLKCFTFDLQ
ncbi:MAG: hypothetical protein IPN43_02835 [Chitinophagaceae bacterium]|nr:hypothetical protein [Chitinophagaceae bacterium]